VYKLRSLQSYVRILLTFCIHHSPLHASEGRILSFTLTPLALSYLSFFPEDDVIFLRRVFVNIYNMSGSTLQEWVVCGLGRGLLKTVKSVFTDCHGLTVGSYTD